MKELLLLSLLFAPSEEQMIKRNFRELYRKDMRSALHVPCILPTTKISQTEIISLYGYRNHPKLKKIKHHDGIDISVRKADVVATGSGVVRRVTYDTGYGKFVEIDHLNGYSTLYGHLSTIFVEVGERVEITTVLGVSGATGRVTGEHIHYEVKRNNQTLNPLYYILLLYDTISGSR